MLRATLLAFILIPCFVHSQDYQIKEGVPTDLDTFKIIFFKHQKIDVKADREDGARGKYLHLRQTNHNQVIKEANEKLIAAASDYPFGYAISTIDAYKPLVKAGYKYILTSKAYQYENLYKQPEEDVLIIYEYFIVDLTQNVAYKVFELDEMKVYDSKLMIKKLNREVKKAYPEAF